jgi:hypothetical protein
VPRNECGIKNHPGECQHRRQSTKPLVEDPHPHVEILRLGPMDGKRGYVCLWHFADIKIWTSDVRFLAQSGRRSLRLQWQLCGISRHEWSRLLRPRRVKTHRPANELT